MDTVIDHDALPRHGRPAPVARSFGWAMLTILGAFLINNILVVWFGFPGVLGIGGEGGLLGWVNLGLYAVAIAGALAIVLTSPNRSLRWDAHLVHNFNVYLVRALFWSIFLVGLFDASIAFLRSENLTVPLFGETLGHLLTRSNFIGPWIHTPLIVLGFVVALFTRTLGFPWLALLIVAAELLIVLSRFVFSYEQALMGDLVRYWYAALFLFASAYTLFEEGHVRVDILYAGLGRTTPPRRVRGFLSTIGITALIFALIAGAPILLKDGGAPDLTPASPAPAAPGTPAAAPALVPNWAIDPETSEIRFSSSYSGKPFSGIFSRWTSDVRFDPEDLAGSAVRVRIDTGSASTGKRLYDDTLDGGEWFDTGTFATAKVNLLNFVSTGGDIYTAEASLLIKGQATNVPLTFTVKIKDDTATFTGETQLSRKALNLGQQSDPGSDWVADEVTVSIKGTATRIE